MTLTVKGLVKLAATQTSAADQGTASFPANLSRILDLTDGTTANKADLMFTDTRTTATESLDLAGSLADIYGNTITFARIKLIMIKAASANTVDIHVGGAATNQFVNWVADASDKVVVKPGGCFLLFAPDATAYAVTAGTGDDLKIAASDGTTSISYDIALIGASA